jgi:hypothetical protein
MFGAGLRRESEDDLQTQLHPPALAVEYAAIQEEISRINKGIGRALKPRGRIARSAARRAARH